MRATLNIPDDLVSEVQKISREKSKTRAIVTAMEAYVRDQKMAALRSLRGKMTLDYDWQKEEAVELQAQEERGKYLEK
ncbi:MAG: type II toxin-antitoxin system VapB family antitoxin [Deltaproteobacteria bacterium]|nr:type II toxin-antitoxin system VapB family antitoxin [Deltaproteobacteria bacterium]